MMLVDLAFGGAGHDDAAVPLPVSCSPKKQSGISAIAQMGMMSAVVSVPL